MPVFLDDERTTPDGWLYHGRMQERFGRSPRPATMRPARSPELASSWVVT